LFLIEHEQQGNADSRAARPNLLAQVQTLTAPLAAANAALAKEQALGATYLTDADGYIEMVMEAHAQTSVCVGRPKAVAAKCGCTW
jgi:hypothetical protein